MAIAPVLGHPVAVSPEAQEREDSDYGTDFDEEAVSDLLVQTADSQPLDNLVLTSIESDPVVEHASTRLLASEQLLQQNILDSSPESRRQTRSTSLQVNHQHQRLDQTARAASEEISLSEEQKDASVPPENDTRSPLLRFRTAPKKPLSVTDIISPAWCEQQYLFSLSKYGRVRRTPAMKQGSSVHKVLEEQVHTSVPVEVQTREDMFGLRLWNVIQGLRTLRATGLTRELAVWGTIDGQVINGVIDELNTTCPDPAMEAKMSGKEEPHSTKSEPAPLENNQTTLEAFLKSSQHGVTTLESMTSAAHRDPKRTPVYYITDVKTRQSHTLPPADSRLRPTQMQLMLYHRLVSDLTAGAVSADAIFERYRLDSTATFSDVFIAEVSKLDYTLDLDDAEISSSQDSVTELLKHNNLAALWSHMIDEYAQTIPAAQSLSPLVSAEFRTATSGAILGRRTFAVDEEQLDRYIADELSWWRGERATRGVEIEEAFKCRICEFADDCDWRKDKVEEATLKARARKQSLKKSGDG